MDPISLIVTALTAGAAMASKDVAGAAIADAYAGLKTLIQKHFENKLTGQVALAESEHKPEIWREPLADALKETQAGQDDGILQAAKRLLELAHPNETKAGKYNITIGSATGTIIGDHATVQQNFGETSTRK